jgi:NAD(P)-dependent dehydrogenase (short-subunit alcohol dehydrogenase family)
MKKWTIADIPSQAGKLAVVTGANSGIGWNTSLELARAGAEVVLAARTHDKGRDAVDRIKHQLPKANVRYDLLDLADLQSVRTFAARINDEKRLDLLVNNAGVMAIPKRLQTIDGFEMQFGTNYLGPFALTLLLMPVLQRSKAPRVTTVASMAANMSNRKIHFEDLQWQNSYSPFKAYCQSKLADLFLMMELARRCEFAGLNLISNSAHPGYARTNLQTTGPGRKRGQVELFLERLTSHDSASGAAPTLLAATSNRTASGTYYAPSGLFALVGDPVQIKVPKAAQDPEIAKRLWSISEQLTDVYWQVETPQRAVFLRR